MNMQPKHSTTLRRRAAKQKKFRQRYLQLRYQSGLTSGKAIAQISDEFNLTGDRCIVIIRPADLRVMLENDWSGTMQMHGLNIPYPEQVKSLDELEAVV